MTNEVITKPFREAHADLFSCAPEYAEQFNAWLPMLINLGKVDQCGVHILDGRILYVGGWCVAGPGVAECFIFPSDRVAENKKEFFAHAQWWGQSLKQKYRRLQCLGEDTPLSKRWLRHLGFTQEGVLRSYTEDGKDMLMWGFV